MNRLRRAWRAFWATPAPHVPPPDGATVRMVTGGVVVEVTLDRYDFDSGTDAPPVIYSAESPIPIFTPTKPWGTFTGSYGRPPAAEARIGRAVAELTAA